jgi:filamentous hemagglutinin
MNKKSVAFILALNMVASPALSLAAPTIPGFYRNNTLPPVAANALPIRTGAKVTNGTADIVNASDNLLNITQTTDKVVIEWRGSDNGKGTDAFNIGSNATVRFYQGAGTPGTSDWKPNSGYVALNRIYQSSPTQIYGKLVADGKVYLINQNGILFGPGSQVNVNTLIASTMNLRDKDFMNNILRFTTENYRSPDYIYIETLPSYLDGTMTDVQYSEYVKKNLTLAPPDTDAIVSNYGDIATSPGGAVYLLGPTVENSGSITAPSGVIGLIAATRGDGASGDYDLQLNDIRDTDVFQPTGGLIVQGTVTLAGSTQGGEVTNYESGRLIADSGLVGMCGRAVNQEGLVRAVTAVKKGGMIELLATDTITTGENSVTSCPIDDSTDTADSSFGIKSGKIVLSGLTTGGTFSPARYIVHKGAIAAPSGNVYLEASESISLESISPDKHSSIDVSGVWTTRPAGSAIITPQMNSINLRDDNEQKGGVTQGKTISVDSRYGSSFGDVSGYYGVDELTAAERSTAGGTISIGALLRSSTQNTGDYTTRNVIVDKDAFIGFAGGGVYYGAGFTNTTKLLSGNKVYDISNAPEWLHYDKVLGTQQKVYSRFGIKETYKGLYFGGGNAVHDYSSGYLVGSDAGTLTLEARQIALNGRLDGSATRGVYQTLSAELTNRMGDQITQGLIEPMGGTLIIGSTSKNDKNNVRPDYVVDNIEVQPGAGPDVPEDGKTVLSSDILNAAGLSSLSLYANGNFTMDAGAHLSLASVNRKLDDGTLKGTTINVKARTIDFSGEIDAPGGSVTLALANNYTSYEKDYKYAADNPDYQSLTERILLDSGSRISVAGDRIDNTQAARGVDQPLAFGHSAGGLISLNAYSYSGEGVLVKSGAVLDVSGGYAIASNGMVTGGDAGSLSLSGPNLLVDGDLKGLSLTGNKGGKITFTSDTVQVAGEGSHLPDGFRADSSLVGYGIEKTGLVLAADRLDRTGFTRIELDSLGDATIAAGLTLKPSAAKLAALLPGAAETDTGNASVTTVTPDYLGTSSILLAAGVERSALTKDFASQYSFSNPYDFSVYPHSNYAARAVVEKDARIETAPGGTVTVSGPYVRLSGDMIAPAGTIDIAVKTDPADQYTYHRNFDSGTLLIDSNAQLSAGGYNKPLDGLVLGIPAGYAPMDGGKITLSSTTTDSANPNGGKIVVERDAVLDVSGSKPAPRTFKTAGGGVSTVMVAGSPGSIDIKYTNSLDLPVRVLHGKANMSGLAGGSLSISKVNYSSEMAITADEISGYTAAGFDALSFTNQKTIRFDGSMELTVGRSLTLDAPVIAGTGSDTVSLTAPWITLTNSYYPVNPDGNSPPLLGSAVLNLNGTDSTSTTGFLDVTGGVLLSGFSRVSLEANKDMRLTDKYYKAATGTSTVNVPQYGLLETDGDLTLKAAHIYPTSQSKFTVKSDNGTITVKPGGETNPDTPIYSAFGQLYLDALNGIDQEGFLAAPMGQISFNSSAGRVFLGAGSITTTAGNAMVNIGAIDEDSVWWRWDRSKLDPDILNDTKAVRVNGEPLKSVSATGNEVVITNGAVVDGSGGGSIFGYWFIPDLNGTVNPVDISGIRNVSDGVYVKTRSDRYVILPDNSVQIPGFTYSYTDVNGKSNSKLVQAVHLAGVTLADGTVLKEGTYSLLPEQFAFLPGALVISPLNTPVSTADRLVSKEGYKVVAGYSTVMGTAASAPYYSGYTVRTASDVLKEGHFEIQKFVAGSAGSVSVNGTTAIINGDIRLAALTGYSGGSLSLSGKDITVLNGSVSVLQNLDFDTHIDPYSGLIGTLQVSAASLSGQGLEKVTLGSYSEDKNGNYAGTDSVTIKSGADLTVPELTLAAINSITLESDSQINAGTATLQTNGILTVADRALVHASDTLNLTVTSMDFQGKLQVDHSALNITGNNNVYIVPDGYQQALTDKNNLYLTRNLWDTFSGIDTVLLTSASDLIFKGDTSLGAKNTLTIDAARIKGNANVILTAGMIKLMNSGKDPALASAGPPASGTASLTLNAGQTIVNAGNADDKTLKFSSNTKPAQWNIALDGFGTVNFNSTNDLTLIGVGTLTVPGNINIKAARITTGAYSDASTQYKSSRFTLDAGTGTVDIGNSGGTTGQTSVPGGSLEIKAGNIIDSGVIDITSGRIKLAATNNITLNSGANILARGGRIRTANTDAEEYAYTPGGDVTVSAGSGTLALNTGSVIDVSADLQGNADAGSIALYGPKGVTLDGDIRGNKGQGGLGGSFELDALQLDDGILHTLIGKLTAGGFDRAVGIRARTGDLDVSDQIKASAISLEADGNGGTGGNITISGSNIQDVFTLDASGSTSGGAVRLDAKNVLTLKSGNTINIHGDKKEGEAWLNAEGAATSGDALVVESGSVINAGIGSSGASGGTVHFRAPRMAGNDDIRMSFKGTVQNASSVTAEAVKVFSPNDGSNITANDIQTIHDDTLTFMTQYSSNPLLKNPNLAVVAGIEIQGGNSLTLATDWDFTSWLLDVNGERYAPGVLTLRAAKDLNINANMVDYPYVGTIWDSTALRKNTVLPSWAFNLTAGADLSAADPLAVNRQLTGNFTIGNDNMVYSENAPIRFASAGDTVINRANTSLSSSIIFDGMWNSLGTFNGNVTGKVGGNLTLNGGVIQTATGDISLDVGGDVSLNSDVAAGYGTIRTTGQPDAEAEFAYVYMNDGTRVDFLAPIYEIWNYRDGGSITLSAGGKIDGAHDSEAYKAWDYATSWATTPGVDDYTFSINKWSARYCVSNLFDSPPLDRYSFTQGIATMAGGDVTIRSGGDVASQIGTFGAGDLSVYTSGDAYGRYLVANGSGSLAAMGNIGVLPTSLDSADYHQPVIQLLKATEFNATAYGDMTLGTIMNPTLDGKLFEKGKGSWFPTYSPDGNVGLTSLGGTVSLLGTNPGYLKPNDLSLNLLKYQILPASLDVSAAADILLYGDSDITLAPSPTGELRLYAGGSIGGMQDIEGSSLRSWKVIRMSDLDMDKFYTTSASRPDFEVYDTNHGPSPNDKTKSLHSADKDAAVIKAKGDISGLEIYVPKKTVISAGEDIRDVYVSTQNQTSSDVTSISAGRDIILTRNPAQSGKPDFSGIQHGGPGTLFMWAGGNMDLGNSQGIQTIGNGVNSYLDKKGSTLVLLVGTGVSDMPEKEASGLFLGYTDADGVFHDGLQQYGDEYSELLARGEKDQAQEKVSEARQALIEPLFENASADGGYLRMVSSAISTNSDKDDIYIIAAKDIDVGRSIIRPKTKSTTSETPKGIYTATGGAINIFTGNNLNVNESRVMTFFGGNIVAWSDQGNINAGRGSKTAINATPPKQIIKDGIVIGYKFTPPAAGSGIRALTYNPNTVPGGTLATPDFGDVHLFAPNGDIDAGEAGIAGGKVVLGATQVLNAQNISFSAGSVGVPSGSEAGISLGSLSGAGSVAEAGKLAEQAALGGSANDMSRKLAETMEKILSGWLDVKVIGFDAPDAGQ